MVKILKRNGINEPFKEDKIFRAITLASGRANVKFAPTELKEIAQNVYKRIENCNVIPVQDMHTIVIEEIRKLNEDVAKCYEDYKGYKQNFNKTFSRIMDSTRDLLENGNKENANKNSQLISTKKELTSGIVSKNIALDYELPKDVAKAHVEGYIHNHDLTDEIYGSINCCLFDMAGLLENSFKVNGVDIKEPNHLETALSLISDVILTSSSQQFGGYTVPEIDITLGKYVKMALDEYEEFFKHTKCAYKSEDHYKQWVKDYVYRILKHGVLNFFDHRLNTITNSNGQTSFTVMSFGLGTNECERMVTRAILEARMEGIGKYNITAIFPKLVFLHRREINGDEDSPNYDLKLLALKCSCKQMYPDWLSLDNGYLGAIFDKYKKAISPMGCRAFLSPWYKRGGDKPKDKYDEPVFVGRANCGAVSLNLPRYALESDYNLDNFYELLDKYFDLAIKKHVHKFNKLKGIKASSNPLFFCEGGCHIKLKPNDTIEEAVKTFTWSIGYIGLDEVTRYFTGKGIHEDNSLAISILEHLQAKILLAKKETGLLIALYSTPAENLCYRFCTMDRAKFGIVSGVTDKEFYTNSYHVDVRVPISAIDKQDVEKPCFDIATGGRIVYNEFPQTRNEKAVLQVINYAMSLGLYFGINLSDDNTCRSCGYHGVLTDDDKCPKCGGSDVVSINRVCGYLGYRVIEGDTRFNHGKLQETKSRTSHFD